MSEHRTIVAFRPSNADYVKDGYAWSIYNNGLENPYSVEKADEKMNRVEEQINPEDYEREDHEHWIRLDYDSVIEGNPKRLHVPKTNETG